jgi:hypothetical protein
MGDPESVGIVILAAGSELSPGSEGRKASGRSALSGAGLGKNDAGMGQAGSGSWNAWRRGFYMVSASLAYHHRGCVPILAKGSLGTRMRLPEK